VLCAAHCSSLGELYLSTLNRDNPRRQRGVTSAVLGAKSPNA
jgi:hypothetical protein